MAMIELKDALKIYNKDKDNELYAMNNVNLSVEEGELIAILGTSGAGKSTLLHVLSCLDTLDAGSYSFDGELISNYSERDLCRFRNSKMGIVMQDFALIEEYTAIQNVMIPLFFSDVKKKDERIALAGKALAAVGIRSLAQQTVNTMSGGQKQRVAIARALVLSPKLILADEPTGALDTKTSDEIMSLLIELNRSGRTVIIVTHDPLVAEKCHRILKMSDGVLTEV